MSSTPYERVMDQVVPDGDCLIFTGHRDRKGYGVIEVATRKLFAHRLVLEHHHGPSPLRGLHSCDTPACVAIEHLRYGTQQENADDMVERGRVARPRGEANPAARLTDEIVRDIRSRRDAGARLSEIAGAYRISKRTVSAIVNRHRWAHVE